MVEKVLSEAAKNALALLGKKRLFREDAYLAGGTAVALHLGHRFSSTYKKLRTLTVFTATKRATLK